MKQKRAYQYRCYLIPSLRHTLVRTFGCVRFVFNWGCTCARTPIATMETTFFYHNTSAALTTLKRQPETIWLNEVSSVPPQQALRHLDKAFKKFFAGRAEYPTFKKKHGRQSAEYTTSAFMWDGEDLLLAKMTEPLPIQRSRPLPEGAKLTTIIVTKDQAGRYFVSFLVEVDIQSLPVSQETVGIDLGLHDVVTLSTGEKIGNEHFFTQQEKHLACLQRWHAKKWKGSENREKARRKVARLHARIADRRRDFLHKLTTKLIRENQVVCVESLAVKHLLQNHHLAKAIADVGWGGTHPPTRVQGCLVWTDGGGD